VEYALLDERLVAWVVSKEGVQTVDLKIDTNTLDTNIAELARLDRDRNSPASSRNSIAAELYRNLVAPLSKYLDPAKTLVIVPDKSLYYVPFAALVTEEEKFLIERFTVSYAPSSTIFVSNSKDRPAGDDRKTARLLSVGDPDFERGQFPGLSGLDAAKDEAREIGRMMPGARVFTGVDATKDTFMRALANAEIVHFAGHYVADPEVPSRSKLVFAGKDGGLRMSEITAKKMLNLQLVVLSACETGIDNVMRGEGAISASRAFLAAGATVVVASQWKVDSEASAKLMVAFHRNRQQGLNSAAALKRAQMEMINDRAGPFASPYYWAAFGVTGGLEN
jgi:CHAT domain-containing protein